MRSLRSQNLKADTATTLSGYGITDAVAGPASAVTDGVPVLWDGTDGRLLKQVSWATFKTSLSLVKADVGLGNVDNTSDANKPVSTAQQTALDAKVTGPASVTDGNPAVFDTTSGKLVKHVTFSAFKTSLSLVKGDVGLGNVDNTADTAKPVSTAQQTALDLKANLASPALTGTPTAPTASGTTNTMQIATTAMVQAALAAYIAAQDALVFKGVIDCSANPNYPAADAGHVYKVSVAGKIGGASGPNVEVGDVLTCITDSSASGNHATVGANWIISQVNIDGAVTGPASATSGNIAVFNGTTGKIISEISYSTFRTNASLVVGTNVQAWDTDLDAYAALSTTGMAARTGSGTAATRTITGTTNQITVTNGNGVSGDPTISLPADVQIPTVVTTPNTGLHIQDTNASHDLIIAPGSDLTADRTLTITTGDANRTLDISAASVTVSSFMATVLDDTSATTAKTTLGIDALVIGDILMTGRANPGVNYVSLAAGGILLQASYPALYSSIWAGPYAWNFSTQPTITAPSGTARPGSATNCIAFSPTGQYVAIGETSSAYIRIDDFSSGSAVKITDPATLPTGSVNGVAWSPDGRYLAVAHNTSPFVSIYDFNSGSPVKIANPASLPPSNAVSACWSPDGNTLVLGLNGTSPYILAYDMSSGTPTRLTSWNSVVSASNSAIADCAWFGNLLAVVFGSSPYFHLYDMSSGGPSRITNTWTAPAASANCLAWSAAGRYLAVGHASSPYVTVYDLNSGIPSKLTNPGTLPSSEVKAVAWSPSGLQLCCGSVSTSNIRFYDYTSGSAVNLVATNQPAGGALSDLSWAGHGYYLAFSTTASTYWGYYVFATPSFNPATEFTIPTVANGWIKIA